MYLLSYVLAFLLTGSALYSQSDGIETTSNAAMQSNYSSGAPQQHSTYWGFEPLNWEVDMIELPAADYLLQDQYPVYIPAFRISRFQVTQQLYHIVMRLTQPEYPYKPMVRISWFDAVRFANELSHLAGLQPAYRIRILHYQTGTLHEPQKTETRYEVQWLDDRNGYRLPTEAEWEYAAQGGAPVHHFLYSGSNTVNNVAWYNGNTRKLRPVGQKEPNEIGLYDMSGNAWDWLWDRFTPLKRSSLNPLNTKSKAPIQGPKDLASFEKQVWQGPSIYNERIQRTAMHNSLNKQEIPKVQKELGELRVCRGGGWNFAKKFSEVQQRNSCVAKTNDYVSVGFRLSRSITPHEEN